MQGRRRFRTYLLIAGRSSTLTHSLLLPQVKHLSYLLVLQHLTLPNCQLLYIYYIFLIHAYCLIVYKLRSKFVYLFATSLASKLIVYFAKSYALNSKYCTLCIDQIFTMSALKICKHFFIKLVYIWLLIKQIMKK